MTSGKRVCMSLGWMVLVGGAIVPPSHATTTVYDNPVVKSYAEDKRNCSGLTVLPVECRFPRYYRVRRIEGLANPIALNNVGQVVGQTPGADHRWHAAVWSKGSVTDIGMLGCRETVSYCQAWAKAANDLGQVVGETSDYDIFSPYYQHAFVWTAGTMSRLPEPGPEWSSATDINNNGVIVGYGRAVPDYLEHGWVNNGGNFTVIGDYGESGRAYAVNENNQVVGGITFNAFLLSGDTMTILGSLGGSGAVAYDINDAATPNVIGVSNSTQNQRRGFLWRPGVMFDLDVLPGADFSIARAINNRGQIVGQSGEQAVLWQNGEMREINRYLNPNAPRMRNALDIDKRGKILAQGQDGAYYLLNPRY